MKRIISSLLFLVLFSQAGKAQKSDVFNTPDGAIHGYDPVAYFNEHKAVKGDKKYALSYHSATWYFENQKNQELFKANPKMYAPQYGGYCAYGLAEGHKAPTEPDAFTVVDGKLYLNYNKDIQKTWKEKQAAYIVTADKNWPSLKDDR